MAAAAPIPDPLEDAPGADAWERTLLDRQIARLDALADLGMAFAADITRRAKAADDAAPLAELQRAALDFSRVARAVRMTVALQSRLVTEFKTRGRPAAGGDADDDDGYDPATVEVLWLGERSRAEKAKQARLERAISHAAHDTDLDRDTVERLVLEAGERLERDDIWDALKTLSFDEAVARICADLGLAPDLPRERQFAGGGGPPADPGAKPGEERGVEREGLRRHALASPLRDSS